MNGQAKIDFFSKYNFDDMSFNLLTPLHQNALKIEWFDSVDIYVNALKYGLKWKPICEDVIEHTFGSRKSALNFALLKAVELYNLKFKQNE